MKHCLFIFFILIFCFVGKVQKLDSNQTKYQTYKKNLKYFRVVGKGPKRSIIGERRGGLLSFGDGGVNQGWYIGVLATEYAVLIKKGDKTAAQKTIKELYCALLAIDRLDAAAQTRYDQDSLPNYTAPLNAIALRTDGWSDIADTAFYKAINAKNRTDYPVGFNGKHWVDITTLERQYYAAPHNHDYFSQDQLYHLLMGLYLTYHYVPGEHAIMLNNEDEVAVNLKEKAKIIALRFIHTVADNHFKLKTPSGKTAYGGNAVVYANPLIGIAKAMGSSYNFKLRNNFIWNLSGGFGASWPFHQTDLAHMHLVMAAVSNERFSITRSNAKAIYRQAKDKTYCWEAFYPLLHNNLWGTKAMGTNYYQLVKKQLNTAPLINPENSPSKGPKGWRSYPKFMKSKEHQDNGSPYFTAYYSGIDYMLLYNLYELRITD